VDKARWQRLQPILDEVLDLPVDERRARLDERCGRDLALRAEIESLLTADAEDAGVLDGIDARFVEEALRAVDSATAPDASRSAFDEPRLLPGARVAGRYRIVSLLGRGGMGEVYRADDLKLGQPVALKFLAPRIEHTPSNLQRLLEEARLARQVSHPNVCRVYDVGDWNDRHFISMEYIDGEDLASLIRRIGALPRQKALDMARQLCAGLEAAHRLGVLHRDLKPSNVMLDGRGQVRVTDFGLAVAAASLNASRVRAGTPAYMAPELLDGKNAAARSDIYALGLVLYELFTGRRAFQADTVDALRRLQEESSPTYPSRLVDGFDPDIERAILRCLEKDPTLRPASARDVAMSLPGSDALAAAMAAGETPSPEIVAVSGPEGSLQPARAFAVLAATVAMLVVLMLLSNRSSMLAWLEWPRSADALEDNARGILVRLGHDAKPFDRTHLLYTEYNWISFIRSHDFSASRWNPLREPGQLGFVYFYRQAQQALVPLGRNGLITDSDPRPVAGDAQIVTDLRGRLIWLLVLPEDAEPAVDSAAAADWSKLFHEAGLDTARFQPVPPTRNPKVTAEERAAWSGVLPEFGGYPIRVEAAAHRGTPVFFEVVLPWDPYWDPAKRTSIFQPPIRYLVAILTIVMVAGVLAIRNWLSGRGDRSGAFRIAAAVFILRFAVWMLGGHHVRSGEGEWMLLLIAVGKSLTDAAASWCFYLALEPHARRIHPRFVISWTRLIRGRVRDPLVGRDILFGVALSTLVILFWGELYTIIPHALGLQAPPPPFPHPLGPAPFFYLLDSPMGRTLLGARHVLEAVPAIALFAFTMVLFWMMVMLALRVILRKSWAAITASLVLISALTFPTGLAGFNPIGLACAAAGAAIIIVALRLGLLGVVALWFSLGLWMNFPVTARLDVPHFATGLVAVLLIAALAAYGAFTAATAAQTAGNLPSI
jgi:eukaryotic-like serine/threonine-protein kinase